MVIIFILFFSVLRKETSLDISMYKIFIFILLSVSTTDSIIIVHNYLALQGSLDIRMYKVSTPRNKTERFPAKAGK